MADGEQNGLDVLDGPFLAPAHGGAPDALVVLLHGVGANGQDLIGLAPFFQEAAPGALFVSPHAPFEFDMMPGHDGRQWFSLAEPSADNLLAGAAGVQPILDAYLDARIAELEISAARVVLIGFSQGTMTALHTGLRRTQSLGGILGYSGMLVGTDVLAGEIKTRPPVLLVHGEEDPVVPFGALAEAEQALKAVNVAVETCARPGVAHGIDEGGIAQGVDFLRRILAT